MYKVGDYIICGNNGVCKVDAVGKMNGSGKNGKLYYTLTPLYTSGSRVYTPVDNEKIIMRPVLSKEEADRLILKIPKIKLLWVPDEKRREQIYKEALRTCNCEELIKIIKTLYLRKEERVAEGKKVIAVDDKYLHLAEEFLYGELAISLEMDKGKVEQYITDCVEKLEIQ